MTCIVGLSDGKTVWIGADSAGVGSGWDLTVRADSKIFQVGPFLMGFTTSFRMGQLLRYSLTTSKQGVGVTDERYMVTEFIPAVRRCLKDGGFAKKENEREEGGQFLVGYRGRLYIIEGDYQVGMNACGYAAVGCGFAYAMGSLTSTPNVRSRERVYLALEAAEKFSAGVRKPFKTLKL